MLSKVFVVSGFHFHPDEGEYDVITEVCKNRTEGAQRIKEILSETFPDEKFTREGCQWGNDFESTGGERVQLELTEFKI